MNDITFKRDVIQELLLLKQNSPEKLTILDSLSKETDVVYILI